MITIENLTKKFGSFTAVDNATFTVPTGRVTGFLGPNGAGKSTTMRMLTGLASIDAGSATFDGRRFTDLPVPGREVGVMLDASAQNPGLAGIEVLRCAALTNRQPLTRAADMLERVGLAGAGGKRVGQYSLGMRQRLGIGVALMGDPHTLVLDEPANGLDPQGIHWMRSLLAEFAAGGGTVLLSSHLLGEVSAVANHLVIINHGRIVAEGAPADLVATGSDLETTFLSLTAA